jgi:ParB family chromosome partitioning protein
VGRSRRALGRGLDALIPRAVEASVHEVALDAILPNPNQPRKRFDEARLAELADSIRTHGVLQPLIVSSPDQSGRYRLVIGERRWQAARLAGLDRVPVVIREASDAATLELALVENLQRQDLDPLEEAAAFERLIRGFGLTQEAVAQRVGRSRSSIANALRLLTLPSRVKAALLAGEITEGHARALLGIDDPLTQEALVERIVAEGLNVRQTEELVRGLRTPHMPRQRRLQEQPAEVRAIEDHLRAALGTKVTVQRGRRRGRIVIEFYSDEELQHLYERLSRG